MLLAAVFEDGAKAQQGTRVLREVHTAGDMTLYAHALMECETRRRRLSVREPFQEGLIAAAPAATALVGALVSLVGGPMTAAMMTIESGIVAAVRDVFEAGLDPVFLEDITARLCPGNLCIIAEVDLEEPLSLEVRIAKLGGRMMCQEAQHVRLEELVLREAEALRRTQHRLLSSPPLELEADEMVIRALRWASAADLRQCLARAKLLAATLRREAVAKVTVLRAQAAMADGAARQLIDARARRLRTELEDRARRLDGLIEEMGPLVRPSPGGGLP
jgi:hypothetical protein